MKSVDSRLKTAICDGWLDERVVHYRIRMRSELSACLTRVGIVRECVAREASKV